MLSYSVKLEVVDNLIKRSQKTGAVNTLKFQCLNINNKIKNYRVNYKNKPIGLYNIQKYRKNK